MKITLESTDKIVQIEGRLPHTLSELQAAQREAIRRGVL